MAFIALEQKLSYNVGDKAYLNTAEYVDGGVLEKYTEVTVTKAIGGMLGEIFCVSADGHETIILKNSHLSRTLLRAKIVNRINNAFGFLMLSAVVYIIVSLIASAIN